MWFYFSGGHLIRTDNSRERRPVPPAIHPPGLKQELFMPKAKNQQSQESKTEVKAPAAEQQCCEVDFVFECNGAEHVYVCGGFNDWHPTCLRMIGNPDSGLWEKRLLLPPGRHEYKFVVDGEWLDRKSVV